MAPKIPSAVAAAYEQTPSPQRETMLEMRARILEVIPDAVEMMKYGMPTFIHEGKAVAGLLGHTNHVGFYPYSGSLLAQMPEITQKYSTTKSAIHVSIDKPMPKALVRKVIRARISL